MGSGLINTEMVIGIVLAAVRLLKITNRTIETGIFVIIAEQGWMVIKMDDLISRQAAVDSLNDEYHGMISDESMKIYQIVEWLNTLPSAQPEIIRCKDCREFRRWIDTDITFCDLTESERDALDFCSRAERRTR